MQCNICKKTKAILENIIINGEIIMTKNKDGAMAIVNKIIN